MERLWVNFYRRIVKTPPAGPLKCFDFLCQLTCQSADIMSSLCGVGVRVRVNNFFAKTTRPRDMLFSLKDTLSIEDEKLFKASKSVFLLRKIALPYPHKCLVWFCGAKHIDRQEFFKEIFLS